MADAVGELTATTFDEAVNGAEHPVVVDFWAEWCGPCHALAPILDELAVEHRDELRFYKVDADAYPDLALRYQVMSMPTLLVFDRGQLVQRLIGARGKQHLLADLTTVLPALS